MSLAVGNCSPLSPETFGVSLKQVFDPIWKIGAALIRLRVRFSGTPPMFTIDDLHKAYVQFFRIYGEHPSIMELGDNEYAEMTHVCWSIYPSLPIEQRSKFYEDSFSRFNRLLKVGIFCYDNIVLKIVRVEKSEHFQLKIAD